MKKTYQESLATTPGRAFVYLSIFILGAALHDLTFRLMGAPFDVSNGALLLTLVTLALFVIVGSQLAREGVTLSRIASASTLLVLAFIALRIGHAAMPDVYLLVAALAVAVIGAQPVLHRQLASSRQTAAYGALTAAVSVVIAVLFALSMLALDRLPLR